MKKVVITGIGILSPLGNTKEQVLDSLKNSKSGLRFNEEYRENGMRCHVSGTVDVDITSIDRKMLRFMSETSAYSFLAASDAILDSGLSKDDLENEGTGVVVGSGNSSTKEIQRILNISKEKGVKKIGPYSVTKTMSNTTSAVISTFFKTLGVSYSIASACSTSLHCISHGYDLIRTGRQNIVIAGGSEDVHWSGAMMFDAMGALSTSYNDSPSSASRPYDANRDGFIPSSGGGIVIIEDFEHAKKRGANIYGEIISTFETSDGYSLVSPSGEGAMRCMKGLSGLEKVDYINTHGTSTPIGDISELNAISSVFKNQIPDLSSTKSLTGHTLGAAGVHEVIFSLLMMENSFIAASANIERLDESAKSFPIITEVKDKKIEAFLSNSFGFGGTNGSVVIAKV